MNLRPELLIAPSVRYSRLQDAALARQPNQPCQRVCVSRHAASAVSDPRRVYCAAEQHFLETAGTVSD